MFIIRVDDVGWGTNHSIDYGMQEYSNFHKLFADRDIPYCAGVIPAACDPTMLKWMEKNFYPGVSTFIHGWDHLPLKISKETGVEVSTEFTGLPFARQYKLIARGVDQLRSLKPIGFIAPFNSYDLNTIEACIDLKLRYFLVGAEKRTGFKVPKLETYRQYGKYFYVLPEEWSLYFSGDYNDLLQKIDTILSKEPKKYPHIISLHCTWEYPNIKSDYLPRLLDILKDRVIDINNFPVKTSF